MTLAVLAGALIGSCLVSAVEAESTTSFYGRSQTRRADTPAPFDWNSIQPSNEIVWTDCEGVFKCARLNLPLDYLAPPGSDNRTTAIALQLLPATDRANRRGTILVNPGGPGDSGTALASSSGAALAALTGGSFDILGFDPRGVGASTPRAECFDSAAQRRPTLFGVDDRLLGPAGENLPSILAVERLVAERCEAKIGGPDGIGRFLSTASVARDMLEITERLGQEKVQFWGFSYGSVLGQYFAAMYPDKVGRIAIDGVYDAYNYRAGLWNSNLEDTEKVLSAFGELCFQAGPEKCPFYSGSADDINARVLAAIAKLDAEPIPLSMSNTPVPLTGQAVQQFMFLALYTPLDLFPVMALVFRAIEDRDAATLSRIWDAFGGATTDQCTFAPVWVGRAEALGAIACADADPLTYSAPEFAVFYRNMTEVSPFAAPIWGELHLKCMAWKVRPAWRYTGELAAANTSTPLLVISPRFDPATPLRDAEAVAARYGGARLLVQNSYGHSSLAAPSLCSAKHIKAYFEDGTLPPEGTVCEADELPIVGAPACGKAKRALSVEDQKLVDALKHLQGHVPMLGYSGRFSSGL